MTLGVIGLVVDSMIINQVEMLESSLLVVDDIRWTNERNSQSVSPEVDTLGMMEW